MNRMINVVLITSMISFMASYSVINLCFPNETFYDIDIYVSLYPVNENFIINITLFFQN